MQSNSDAYGEVIRASGLKWEDIEHLTEYLGAEYFDEHIEFIKKNDLLKAEE